MEVLWLLVVIAVQTGVQPILVKAFIPAGTPTSSLVLGCELIKLFSVVPVLWRDGAGRDAVSSWNIRSSLLVAGFPSVTYLVQNYLVQIAYQSLDSVVFNVLNQTKALFTALFGFLFVGRRQSRVQCAALVLVTLAGGLASTPERRGGASGAVALEGRSPSVGVACCITAAALSGLGSGISEWALQRRCRNSFLLTAELSALGCSLILASLLLGLSADSEVWWREGLFTIWRPLTALPVLTQALGGILVGVILKVASGVQKVLATICGLILTCILQQLLYGRLPGPWVCLSVLLAATGIFLHASSPPSPDKKANSD